MNNKIKKENRNEEKENDVCINKIVLKGYEFFLLSFFL